MRIVTWNCNFGSCLDRAEELAALQPDIVVLQECARSTQVDSHACHWYGGDPAKGVAVFAYNGFTLARGPIHASVPNSVFPVTVSGAMDFNLLAVWALPDPTYARAIARGLDAYAGFITSAPTIIAGDFNTHARWDMKDRQCNHSSIVERLDKAFDLVSAYHAYRGGRGEQVVEEPTLYYRWKHYSPFHIDYCFVPKTWLVHEACVGSYEAWQGRSDHRPLVVDVSSQESGHS